MKIRVFVFILCLPFTFVLSQNNADFLKGKALIEKGEYDQAEIYLEKAVLNQVEESVQFNLGKVYYYQHRYDLARKALGQSGKNTESFLWLARVEAADNNAQKGIVCLRKYLQQRPLVTLKTVVKDTTFSGLLQTEAWKRFVAEYQPSVVTTTVEEIEYQIKEGNTDRALQVVDGAFDNKNVLNHQLKAEIYTSANWVELASYEWGQALLIDPGNLLYLKNRGDCYFTQNKFEEAAKDYLKCLEANIADFGVQKKLAQVQYVLGNYEASNKQIKTYLNYFEDDKEAILLVSKTYQAMDDSKSALKSVNMLFATEGKPEADWYTTRGKIFFETGAYKYSIEDLSMSLDLVPDDPEANLMLGKSYQKTGNAFKACHYFKRAAQFGSKEAIRYVQGCE